MHKGNSVSALPPTKRGFTIVELLVVIVVIGILAAVTIISYTGISQRAKEVSLKADLDNASKLIKLYQVSEPSGNFPTDDVCTTPGPTEICLQPTGSNTFDYEPSNSTTPKTFVLDATNGDTTYRITNDTAPEEIAVEGVCPSGFIPVPGSATYGTSDFCVMKYEAKRVGATNVPVSEAAGLPWTSITQTDALTFSPNVAGCTGCHLITEAEWLTITQNVLNVPSNWSTNIVGSGYIYSGHNDSVPLNSLEADSNDSNGYIGTGQSAPSNQRRTLTLSNGEVIWDMAGNVWDWTSGTVQTPTIQPGVNGGGYTYRDWNAITNLGTISPDLFPAATGISGANSWDSVNNGIGKIYSNSDQTALRGFLRGGYWNNVVAGVFSMSLDSTPGYTHATVGFRVSQSIDEQLIAPSAPTISANTITDTTTWSWPAVSCSSGSTARYQYRYTISPSGYDSGWTATANSPVSFTTSTAEQTYTVQVQAQCFLGSNASGWSGTGQASYYRPIALTAIAAISGTKQAGSVLTAGILTPSGATATYNWQSSTTAGGTYTDIPGANASTYTLVAGDIGKYIKSTATGTGDYSGTVTSIASTIVLSDSNWIAGIGGTVLEGKYVRATNLGTNYTYKTTASAVASPQGATGLDPDFPAKMVLVNPQTNPAVDFSLYPAQNACKAVGGRLPNMNELRAINTGRASYGNPTGQHWSATEYDNNGAYALYFNPTPTTIGYPKNGTDNQSICITG